MRIITAQGEGKTCVRADQRISLIGIAACASVTVTLADNALEASTSLPESWKSSACRSEPALASRRGSEFRLDWDGASPGKERKPVLSQPSKGQSGLTRTLQDPSA